MQEDAEKGKAAVEEEFDGDVELRWNITNGEITDINMVFSNSHR